MDIMIILYFLIAIIRFERVARVSIKKLDKNLFKDLKINNFQIHDIKIVHNNF